MRRLLLVALLAGCSSSYEQPPQAFGGFPTDFDSGPPRVCGIVEGSKCDGNGELARCLCGTFEEQVGRFVCCRGGVATASACVQASYAVDCDGKPVTQPADAGSTD